MKHEGHDDKIEILFPKGFLNLTRRCEVWCVSGCCGLDAFSFDELTMRSAVEHLGVSESEEACDEVLPLVISLRDVTRACYSGEMEFNHIWADGEELAEWLRGLISKFQDAIRISQEASAKPLTGPAA